MAVSSFLACGGDLPVALPSSSWLRVHLIGCAVAQDLSLVELVLFARVTAAGTDARGEDEDVLWGSDARQRVLTPPPVLLAKGYACEPAVFLLHGIRITCPGSTRRTINLELLRNGSIQGYPELPVPLIEKQINGSQLVCDARVPFGSVSSRCDMIAAARRAWAQVGFTSTLTFAREATTCDRLSSIGGVSCEVRSALDSELDTKTHHSFDQSLHLLLCLAYARASGASFLALADTDDFPGADLPKVLQCARQNATMAGFRLFFDARRRCPTAVCPASIEEIGSNGVCDGACDHAACWKPIVVPDRVDDLSIHWAAAKPSFQVHANVWGVCLHHLKASGSLRNGPLPERKLPSSAIVPKRDVERPCAEMFGGFQFSRRPAVPRQLSER